MKLLVATRADENIRDITDITHPMLKYYAKKWRADFIVITKLSDCPGEGKYYYRILEFYNLLDEYDRILHLDSDIIINKNCPNIFEIVPEAKIGTILEDKGSRTKKRQKRMKNAQKLYGNIGWNSNYINTGVFCVSRQHKKIFQKINDRYYEDYGRDDVHLGYNIKKYNFEIYELPFQFNHMTMFSEPWNGSPNRFESYIIHYAGDGIFDKGVKSKIEQIKKDYFKIYRDYKFE